MVIVLLMVLVMLNACVMLIGLVILVQPNYKTGSSNNFKIKLLTAISQVTVVFMDLVFKIHKIFYYCQCPQEWRGDRCEIYHACEPNPCENNGVCAASTAGPVCFCPSGFVGESCEFNAITYFNIDCRIKGCNNNGVCTADGKCVCNNAWGGQYCDQPTACASNPCQNGGVCSLNNMSQVQCTCPGSWFGDLCDQEIEFGLAADCRTSACQNGGTCGLFQTKYICICPAGYHGSSCELSPHCNPNPCQHSSVCMEHNNDFICLCNGIWTGKTCTISIPQIIEDTRVKLTAEVDGIVTNTITTDVTDDITELANNLNNATAQISVLEGQINALRTNIQLTSTVAAQDNSDLATLKTTTATKAKTEQIRALLEELLTNPPSPPGTIIIPFLGLLSIFLLCLM